MAEPLADNADVAVDDLKRKARRRLIGAVVLALAAATLLPLLLEQEQRPLGDDVSVQIPPVDDGKFVGRLAEDKGKAALTERKSDGTTTARADARPETKAAASPAVKVEPKPETKAPPVKADAKPESRGASPSPAKGEVAAEARGDAKSPARPISTPAAKTGAVDDPGADSRSKAVANATRPSPAAGEAKSATPAAETARADAKDAAAPELAAANTGADSPKGEGYVVQLGAFTDVYGARTLSNKLKKAGYPAYTEPVETSRGTLWRVRVGSYASRASAAEARDRLKADGQNGIVAAAK